MFYPIRLFKIITGAFPRENPSVYVIRYLDILYLNEKKKIDNKTCGSLIYGICQIKKVYYNLQLSLTYPLNKRTRGSGLQHITYGCIIYQNINPNIQYVSLAQN